MQVTIVVSWWSIFGFSPRVERGSGIITYIGIHMIANYEFPPYLNIFIRYSDISIIMNSTLLVLRVTHHLLLLQREMAASDTSFRWISGHYASRFN